MIKVITEIRKTNCQINNIIFATVYMYTTVHTIYDETRRKYQVNLKRNVIQSIPLSCLLQNTTAY